MVAVLPLTVQRQLNRRGCPAEVAAGTGRAHAFLDDRKGRGARPPPAAQLPSTWGYWAMGATAWEAWQWQWGGPSGQRTSPLGVPGEEENGRYWLREQLTDGAFGCDGGETIHPFVSVSESECEQV